MRFCNHEKKYSIAIINTVLKNTRESNNFPYPCFYITLFFLEFLFIPHASSPDFESQNKGKDLQDFLKLHLVF